jgi:hypothetical protein
MQEERAIPSDILRSEIRFAHIVLAAFRPGDCGVDDILLGLRRSLGRTAEGNDYAFRLSVRDALMRR